MFIRLFCLSLAVMFISATTVNAQESAVETVVIDTPADADNKGKSTDEEKVESNGVIEFIPLLQKQTRSMGATPPKPFFIAPLAYVMGDEMVISNVKASVPDLPGIVIPDGAFKMSNTRIRSNTFGARAGFWLFPFMSIYGMYANSTGYTEFDIELPENLQALASNIETKTKFNANTYAVGMTVAYGMKNLFWGLDVFGNMDVNFSWTNVNILEGTINMLIFSPRVGLARDINKTFNIAVWVGGMYKNNLDEEEQVSGMYSLGNGLMAAYSANQRSISAWNMVAGAKLGISRYFDLVFEAGFINRWAFNVNTQFNF